MSQYDPWRKVLPRVGDAPWWELVGTGTHEFQLELECGHWVNRRALKRPKKVRCEACPPPPCPRCGSDELCRPDCPIAPWNQEPE